MKLGATKIFFAVMIAFVIVALGSPTHPTQTQKEQGCGNPPWFNPGGKCNNRQHTYIFVGTVGWPQKNETDCSFYLHVCSLELRRNTKGPLGTKCHEAKDFAQPVICCDEFNTAVKTKQPCDPMQDADCDGLPNDTDEDPLGPRDPDTDNKCKQLGYDVYEAYKRNGASEDTAMGAAMADRHDCIKRRTDQLCGIPTPDPTNDPPVTYPKDPDTDNKCKELGVEIYKLYLKDGANDHTAMQAAMAAREDCRKRRASKM
jgi:hypothetical protein